jgi:hypothetical protein
VLAVLLLGAGILASCGHAASAVISDCIKGPANYLERNEGQPRVHIRLELEVSCHPAHSFELSEVETSADSSVIGIEKRGSDTCIHKEFKARGEKCTIEMFFEPKNPAGPYDTYVTFQYAGETATYITRVDGYIKKRAE